MKKLLLGAMLAAACMTTNVDASFLQTKKSKTNVETTLKSQMGDHYKGMLGFAHALFEGWADTASCLAKDPQFKSEKKILNEINKQLKVITEFTKSTLNRDKESNIDKKASKALEAAKKLHTAMSQFKNMSCWKQLGSQFRYLTVLSANSLQSLARKNSKFNLAGMTYSANDGIIEHGTYDYDLASVNTLNVPHGTTKISGLLAKLKEICRDVFGVQVSTEVLLSEVINEPVSTAPAVVTQPVNPTPAATSQTTTTSKTPQITKSASTGDLANVLKKKTVNKR